MKIILYGAGNYSFWIINGFKKLPEYEIVGLVDSNPHKQGKQIYDFEVKPPNWLKEATYDKIFISSTIAGVELYHYCTEELGISPQKIMNRFADDNPSPIGLSPQILNAYYLYDGQSLYDSFAQNHNNYQDPFSEQYIENILEFFKFVTGSQYTVESEGIQHEAKDFFELHEETFLDIEAEALDKIKIPANGNILEFGCAEGLLCEYVATRYKDSCVTGVDVSSISICAGEKRIAGRKITNAKLICCDYDSFNANITYDVVIFHRSFHHILRHVDLLRKIHDITNTNAKIYLMKEVVCNKYYKPWGLNTNYDSLKEIRNLKWLELIFEAQYLQEAFKRSGWDLQMNDDLTLDFLVAHKL